MNRSETLHPPVFILTRTQGRPLYWRDLRASIEEQTYPFILHLAHGDAYANVTGVIYFKAAENSTDAVQSPCTYCGATSKSGCSRPRASRRPQTLQKFQRCFCGLRYTPNAHVRRLQLETLELAAVYGHGYAIVVDDDKVFPDARAISKLIASIRETDKFLIWRSATGRYVPSRRNFDGCKIRIGDIDSANGIVHTSALRHALWGDRRCGDFRSLSSLSAKHRPRCLPLVGPVNHPFQRGIGGMGTRQDMPAHRVTVVVDGRAPPDASSALALVQSLKACCSDVLAHFILLRDSSASWPPKTSAADGARFDRIVGESDVKNRWLIRKYVSTPYVLSLDWDGAFLDRRRVLCLLSHAIADREAVAWTSFPPNELHTQSALRPLRVNSLRVLLIRSHLLVHLATAWNSAPRKSSSFFDDSPLLSHLASHARRVRQIMLPTNDSARAFERHLAMTTGSKFSASCKTCDGNLVKARCTRRT